MTPIKWIKLYLLHFFWGVQDFIGAIIEAIQDYFIVRKCEKYGHQPVDHAPDGNFRFWRYLCDRCNRMTPDLEDEGWGWKVEEGWKIPTLEEYYLNKYGPKVDIEDEE